jgi:hypothetical protein
MGEVRGTIKCSKGGFSVKDISAVTFAVQSFVTLFVIMDPPGATPIFLGLVADKTLTGSQNFSGASCSCIASLLFRYLCPLRSRAILELSQYFTWRRYKLPVHFCCF